jgi:hypothetical protein
VIKDEVWIGNWIYWTLTLVTTNNYDSLNQLHTPKITVTTAHINSSQALLAVAWYRLPTADVPLPLDSRTLPGLSYQLLNLHNCNSQLTQQKLIVSEVILRPTVSRQVSLVTTSIWGPRPDFCSCQTVVRLLKWGALSDERTGLSFAISGGSPQSSHSRV